MYICTREVFDPWTMTALMELFEPETRKSMVAFPVPIIEPPEKTFLLPLSVILI